MKKETNSAARNLNLLASGLVLAGLGFSTTASASELFSVTSIGSGASIRAELTTSNAISDLVDATTNFKAFEATCGESGKSTEASCGEKKDAKKSKKSKNSKSTEASCGEKGKSTEASCGEKGKSKEASCGEKGKSTEASCGEKGKSKEASCGEK